MSQTITATINHVSDRTREFNGERGVIIYISGTFADDSGWSVGCKPENSEARIAELKGLIGKEGQYEVEPAKEYQGQKQWKLKSWPGKPQPGGGGGFRGVGGREYVPRYRDTEQGAKEERDSIHRSVALTQAVTLYNGFQNKPGGDIWEWIERIANKNYEWLSQGRPQLSQPVTNAAADQGPQKGPASPDQVEAQSRQVKREFEKSPCPKCGGTDAVRFDRGKGEFYCWSKLDSGQFDPATGDPMKGCGHKWKTAEQAATQPEGIIKKILTAIEDAVQKKDQHAIKVIGDRIAKLKDAGSLSPTDFADLADIHSKAQRVMAIEEAKQRF